MFFIAFQGQLCKYLACNKHTVYTFILPYLQSWMQNQYYEDKFQVYLDNNQRFIAVWLYNNVLWYISLYNSIFFRWSCKSAWADLRLTPLFGCICPTAKKQAQQAKCDKIFNIVNGNPCIGKKNISINNTEKSLIRWYVGKGRKKLWIEN